MRELSADVPAEKSVSSTLACICPSSPSRCAEYAGAPVAEQRALLWFAAEPSAQIDQQFIASQNVVALQVAYGVDDGLRRARLLHVSCRRLRDAVTIEAEKRQHRVRPFSDLVRKRHFALDR